MQIEIHPLQRKTVARDLVTRWLINALGLVVVSRLVDGITVEGDLAVQAVTVLAASAILGLVNAAIRPVLLILTLPINILTLGLFTLVINGGMLWLVSQAVRGFEVQGFWPAVVGSLILSIFSMLLTTLFRAGGISVKISK